jgi:asparagine synthase (glutamine-hydrolysing)
MCGFAGTLTTTAGRDDILQSLQAMCDSMVHRGPDDQGIWADAERGVGLGHRRLSIVDLSPEGHQPMHSASGRYVIVFNGEIYNYPEIRAELEQTLTPALPQEEREVLRWRGHSDTEVMLAAFERFGVERALKKFAGMFAFALWDREERVLHLARDRLGEKPLYYGWMGNAFLFGSELKALRAHPAWRGEIDRDALTLYLRHNYIPAPFSIYRGIFKLTPGARLSLRPGEPDRIPEEKLYWSPRAVAEFGANNPFPGDEREALDELERLLLRSVRGQMVADVPLGAFLSGGFDSTAVVALMQAQSAQPVKTFTIGFHEQKFNEAVHAKAVAAHLGAEHTELYVTPEQAMAVIPRLPALYDEPFADSSQIPTFLVSQLARRHVTVSLSGDGGDELFCGYKRYFQAPAIWRQLDWAPPALRRSLAGALTMLPAQFWNKAFDPVAPALKPGDKLFKLAELLSLKNPESLYLNLISQWKTPADLVPGSREPATVYSDPALWAETGDFVRRMMYMDMVSYLPDDILVKVDRAAMGVSLETRVPFLDHEVVEFAWRLPMSMKTRGNEGKWILRRLLDRHVPKAMMERPKMGFGVPIDLWLRGPLRDWAETWLDASRLRAQGYLDPAPIRQKWAEHLAGRRDWSYYLWTVLMFQTWLEAE